MKIFIQLFEMSHKGLSILLKYCRFLLGIIKMYIAFLLSAFKGYQIKMNNIWLVSEKGTEARDNGYYLYKYVKEVHPEIPIYFVITKDSSDLYKISNRDIVILNSFKHFFYCLNAKVSASSQPFGAIPKPTEQYFQLYKKLRRKDQILVHLKHGITKDELPHSLDYSNTHFDLLCCVSEKERKYMQETLGYPDENIKTVGFCRYDNLLTDHETKKQILIMPTHRKWLHATNTAKDASQEEKREFEKTEFYKTYAELLADHDLVELARKNGYEIVFYPHYATQSFISCFRKFANETVIIADRKNYDVQQLLMESALLITDYSSVFFDFAYMGKPVFFYQFDVEQYRSNHFKKGYFDYERDGFGMVLTTRNDLIHELEHSIIHECKMDEKYTERMENFFIFRDTDNCKRVFDEIYRKAISK